MINRAALFCDETKDYRTPCEADAGQRITFYFRTAKNGADTVYLITIPAIFRWDIGRYSIVFGSGRIRTAAITAGLA